MTGLCECGCGGVTSIARCTDASKGWTKGIALRFVNGHNRRRGPVDYIEDANGCWVWQRFIDKQGYGRTNSRESSNLAHRAYFERHRGPIPEGKQLDHVCHTSDKSCAGGPTCPHRRCVNPDHLEPVTNAENARRGQMARLTRSDVDAILASTEPYRVLAERYGVHKVYIGQIRTGKKWVAA